jgi:NADPH:quinone reductase-like Zn-dependent oxidoreductase
LRVKDIDVVLITAAAGGVGHLAVQLAVSTGAHVIATASAEHCDFVKSFGAKLVIDYTSQDVVKTILDHYPGGVDKALNGVAGEDANQILGALREGGVVVDLPGAITLTRPDVRIINDYVVKGDGTRLKEISRLIDTAVLQVDICKIYPFREAQAALQKVLTKHVRGKVGLGIE